MRKRAIIAIQFILIFPIFSEIGDLYKHDIEISVSPYFHCDAALMEQLIKGFHPDIFVETGTYSGDTATTASNYFSEVHTVELSKFHYNAFKEKNVATNTKAYLGDSGIVLPQIISAIAPSKCKLFWLDAHYSGGDTAKIELEGEILSPLWHEISAIIKPGLQNSIILIDDINVYLLTENENVNCPSIHKIMEAVHEVCPTANIYILGSMAIIYDANIHQPTVSQLSKSCTKSRMFNHLNYTREELIEVLSSEKMIVSLEYSDEKERLCYLSSLGPNFHYREWSALVNIGKNHLEKAIEELRFSLSHPDNQPPHWRKYFYLALCEVKLGNVAQARKILDSAPEEFKEYETVLLDLYEDASVLFQ